VSPPPSAPAPVAKPAPAPPKPAPVAEIDKSPEKQRQRAEFIQTLIDRGVFSKTEKRVVARVWVRPAFYGLDFDEKQKLLAVVYAYYYDGTDIADTVYLRDSLNNKDVGSYAPSAGLRLE
jgi:hypothetical protein